MSLTKVKDTQSKRTKKAVSMDKKRKAKNVTSEFIIPKKKKKQTSRGKFTPTRKGVEWSGIKLPTYGTSKENQKKLKDWLAFGKRKGTWYEVYGSTKGSKIDMYRTTSRVEAIEYLKKNKNAIGIQIYKGSLTAGTINHMPNKRKFGSVWFSRAYHGPHTTKFANAVAKDLEKSGLLVRIVDTDRGCYIYTR